MDGPVKELEELRRMWDVEIRITTEHEITPCDPWRYWGVTIEFDAEPFDGEIAMGDGVVMGRAISHALIEARKIVKRAEKKHGPKKLAEKFKKVRKGPWGEER